MNEIKIKKVLVTDLDQLQLISRKTFLETFTDGNTIENINKYLDEAFNVDKLKNELKNKDSEFYFATIDNEIIGYLKINLAQAQTELQDQKSLEVERIYVLKEFHGKKVGQILFDKAYHIARQAKVEYLWLGVWEENPRALNFYRKNGFVEFDKHIFKVGNDEQTDIMMKLNIDLHE